jgi:hypothetical protein
VSLLRRGFLAGLILVLLSAAVASAAVIDAKTGLAIHGRKLKNERVLVTGKLHSTARVCTQGKLIRLYAAVPHKRLRASDFGVVVARTHTNSQGNYRFVLRPRGSEMLRARFPGSFRSSYAGEEYCHASWSRPIRVIVQQRRR